MSDPLTCSAKGCVIEAAHQVVWNNPKVHTPDRRKVWLACDVHQETLAAFLSARDFWIETLPL